MKKYLLLLVVINFLGCAYKFNGASIPLGMKTVNVQLFENNAPLVVPTLSNEFTEDLRNRIRTQSKLMVTQSADADAIFEGNITGYDIRPIAIQDNSRPVAGATRLTITVAVKYTNNVKSVDAAGPGESKSFEQSFTAFTDFSLAGQTFESQQQGLIKKITIQLTENIFNQAFAQW